jgi:hypothetical protein
VAQAALAAVVDTILRRRVTLAALAALAALAE